MSAQYRQSAPVRSLNESAGQYIRRVSAYLSEPDRRRIGRNTEKALLDAVWELETHGWNSPPRLEANQVAQPEGTDSQTQVATPC